MTLQAVAADPTRRAAVAKAGAEELSAVVSDIGGVKGIAVGAALKVVTKLRPNFVQDNVNAMLPAFATALDPHLEAGRASGDVTSHMISNADQIADDLLAITDRKANASSNTVAVQAYNKLRPSAKTHVVGAMPRVAAFVIEHAD